jgi:hypothetical protein
MSQQTVLSSAAIIKKRKIVNRSKSKHTISEAKLRKLIRNELAQEYLINEGFLDKLKEPFKKLNEKAKKYIAEKAEETLGKLSAAMDSLKSNDDFKKVLSLFEQEENGLSFEELIASSPEASKLKEIAGNIKAIEFEGLMKKSEKSVEESMSFYHLKMSTILLEENFLQKEEIKTFYEKMKINESVTAVISTVISGWWALVKGIVSVAGLLHFALEQGSKLAKYMGFETAAEKMKYWAHLLHNAEHWLLEKVAFPTPVLYAAYLAIGKLKGVKNTVKKAVNKGDKEKDEKAEGSVLTYEQFKSTEGKQEKEAALVGLKSVIIAILLFEAISHLAHGIKSFFQAMLKSANDALHVGSEVSAGAKAAGSFAKAAEKGAEAAAAAVDSH